MDEIVPGIGVMGAVSERRAASTIPETDKNIHNIMGFKDLWMLDADFEKEVDNIEKAA